jgi:hypothetical protein
MIQWNRYFDNYQEFIISQVRSGSSFRDTMTVRACPITFHYLAHIWYIIQVLGPLKMTSCRPLERVIGLYKKKKYHIRCLVQVFVSVKK